MIERINLAKTLLHPDSNGLYLMSSNELNFLPTSDNNFSNQVEPIVLICLSCPHKPQLSPPGYDSLPTLHESTLTNITTCWFCGMYNIEVEGMQFY